MYDDRRTTDQRDPMPAQTSPDPLAHPARDEIELAAVLHALSDPVRLQMVRGLAGDGERTCGSFDVPVTKSTCTHHFKVLREARGRPRGPLPRPAADDPAGWGERTRLGPDSVATVPGWVRCRLGWRRHPRRHDRHARRLTDDAAAED